MKTKTQIFIDKVFAKPIAYLLNFITRLAGRLFNIDHSLDKPFKRIAVCKFKGMGSIIQASPLLLALREKYPQAEIIFVSTRANRGILSKISAIDTIVTLDDSSFLKLLKSFITSIFKFIRKRPDVYIDLEIYSDFSTIFTLFTLSKNRFGYYLRSSSYRLGIYTHMMFFNPRVPISEVYMQMVRLLGYTGAKPQLAPLHLNLSNPNPIAAKPYILINPNASDLRIERRWHHSNFRQLIISLLEKYPEMYVGLIGSVPEKNYTLSVIQGIQSDRLINMAGETNLDELIVLIHQARLLITNDTGPMHIAFACQTPTVCLFGPCAPEQYGHNPKASIIYHKVYCSPCVHDFEIPPCKGDNICMQKITQQQVLNQVENILIHNHERQEPLDQTIYSNQKKTIGLIKR